ncbi:hypothetical protein RFN25_31625, partial [Mesorhizobium abyssinicae]|uniref:hypothetical protein n=1 Tax=Mesorhizobium abyssinicae TaxID=1209958 RepID=UPI002A2451E0
ISLACSEQLKPPWRLETVLWDSAVDRLTDRERGRTQSRSSLQARRRNSLHGPPIFPFDQPRPAAVAKLTDLVMPRLAFAALRRGNLSERAYCLT